LIIETLSVEETDFLQHKTDVIHQQQKYNNHKQNGNECMEMNGNEWN
jgi:hypothetical protein